MTTGQIAAWIISCVVSFALGFAFCLWLAEEPKDLLKDDKDYE